MSAMEVAPTVHLRVPGITCEGCVITIRMAVRRVKGVRKVTGNIKERTISVELGPEAGCVDELYEAMARIGYEAEEL